MRKLDVTDITAELVVSFQHLASQPLVGIWWYVRGKVYGVSDLPKNCPLGKLVCVDYEHSRVFSNLQQELAEEIPEIKNVRFNEVERGRVWYVPSSRSYLLTCSTAISQNKEAIEKIKQDFNLQGQTVEVRTEVQYDVFDIRIS